MVLTNIIANFVIILKKFAAVSSSLFISKVQIPCGFTARLLQVLSFFTQQLFIPYGSDQAVDASVIFAQVILQRYSSIEMHRTKLLTYVASLLDET